MYETFDNEMDNLIADVKPSVMPDEVKLKKNTGLYKRGTVLGKVTADSNCVIVNSANADGSEKPYAILSEDIDTTDATSDVVAVGYFAGSYQSAALIFGGTDTVETHREALRDLNIYVK